MDQAQIEEFILQTIKDNDLGFMGDVYELGPFEGWVDNEFAVDRSASFDAGGLAYNITRELADAGVI